MLFIVLVSIMFCLVDGYYEKLNVRVLDFSRLQIPYSTGLRWQDAISKHHIAMQTSHSIKGSEKGLCCGTLVLLQHNSVYTLGTATTSESGPFSTVDRNGEKLEYEVYNSNRAGQATYHGPGQLICYPIFDLNYFRNDIHDYLRNLEEVVIRTFTNYHIEGTRIPGLTGVWVGTRKLAAIGIRISRWVTTHGVSINVNPNLSYFHNIIPCGIRDKDVGSMSQFFPAVELNAVSQVVRQSFQDVFKYNEDYLDADDSLAWIQSLEHR